MQQEKQAKMRILTLRYLMIIAVCFFMGSILFFVQHQKESQPVIQSSLEINKRPQLMWSNLGIENVECPNFVDQQKLYDAISQKKIIEHPCLIIYQK